MTFDITEQKIVEDALRKAHAELEDRVRHRTAELQSEIVERQRAEQALLEEKERVVVTLRSIGDAVITTDPVGRVRSMSPAAEVMTGWPEADEIGRPLAEVFGIFDEDTREPAMDPVRRCIEQGASPNKQDEQNNTHTAPRNTASTAVRRRSSAGRVASSAP